MSLYSRRPIIHLPRSEYSVLPDSEKGRAPHVDDLDRHVENALRKRDKLRQTAAGIWSFIKTRACLALQVMAYYSPVSSYGRTFVHPVSPLLASSPGVTDHHCHLWVSCRYGS
jgi:hypothetical protein